MSEYAPRMLIVTVVLLSALILTAPAAETNAAITADTPAMSDPVTAAQAEERVGETLTVTGRVVSTFFMETSDQQPTFMNLDEAYPNQPLTVVIFGEKRDLFEAPPEQLFNEKLISVTGEVILYKSRPEIVVAEPTAIRILEATAAPSEEDPEDDAGEPAATQSE